MHSISNNGPYMVVIYLCNDKIKGILTPYSGITHDFDSLKLAVGSATLGLPVEPEVHRVAIYGYCGTLQESISFQDDLRCLWKPFSMSWGKANMVQRKSWIVITSRSYNYFKIIDYINTRMETYNYFKIIDYINKRMENFI